jgi:hypothetical protein
MSLQGKKRIFPLIVVALVTAFFAFRAYLQYRPVNIGVHERASRHIDFFKERGWDEHELANSKSIVAVVPYEKAADRYLTREEVRSLRSQMNWRNIIPPRYDSLEIKSSTNVVAWRIERNIWIEYEFVNSDGAWLKSNQHRSSIRH